MARRPILWSKTFRRAPKTFPGANEAFQKKGPPPRLLVVLRVPFFFNHAMVEQVEAGGETVFVRDFAAKTYLLFLFHDLGSRLHGKPAAMTVFGGFMDQLGRRVARLVENNFIGQYRRLYQKSFFDDEMKEIKERSSEFTHTAFLAPVHSGRFDGSCLTCRRRDADRPSLWIKDLITKVLKLTTVGKLLDIDTRVGEGVPSPFESTKPGYVLIADTANRSVARLFSGARFRKRGGVIGSLERTPKSRIVTSYNRDHVILGSAVGAPLDDPAPDEEFLTEVEPRILLRLALGFGFGCDCGETAGLNVWDGAMHAAHDPARSAAWNAFAGLQQSLDAGREMRGGSLEEFAKAYFDLLMTAIEADQGVDSIYFISSDEQKVQRGKNNEDAEDADDPHEEESALANHIGTAAPSQSGDRPLRPMSPSFHEGISSAAMKLAQDPLPIRQMADSNVEPGAASGKDGDAEAPAMTPRFGLKQVAAKVVGQITMLPGVTRDGRLKIDEVTYSLDSLDWEPSIQVGLRSLCVEWNWTEEDHTSLSDPCDTPEGRKACLAAANPTLQILAADRDVARLWIKTKTKPVGTAFPPKTQLAIPSFAFPHARMTDGSQHAFSIHAGKQDLCLGQWNPDTRVFKEMTIGGPGLREADEATLQAAQLALAEIREDFPPDGSRKCLGTRFAQVVQEVATDRQNRFEVRG